MVSSILSVLIRELERQLGFRLFDRTTRQVTLTAFGRELITVTEPCLGTPRHGTRGTTRSMLRSRSALEKSRTSTGWAGVSVMRMHLKAG
jgi:DNA-binding transcriptional LysR family regulator